MGISVFFDSMLLYALGGFAPGRKSEKFGRQANHHILMAHGEGVKKFREEVLKKSKIEIVIDIWNHHLFRRNCPEDTQYFTRMSFNLLHDARRTLSWETI